MRQSCVSFIFFCGQNWRKNPGMTPTTVRTSKYNWFVNQCMNCEAFFFSANYAVPPIVSQMHCYRLPKSQPRCLIHNSWPWCVFVKLMEQEGKILWEKAINVFFSRQTTHKNESSEEDWFVHLRRHIVLDAKAKQHFCVDQHSKSKHVVQVLHVRVLFYEYARVPP